MQLTILQFLLEMQSAMHDIRPMAKLEKKSNSKAIVRSAKSGQFLGRTRDGIAVAKPAQTPKSFSLGELRRVVRDVKREETARKAG